MKLARILVTGGSGQVGGALAALARSHGIEVWAPPRAELDLLDESALRAAVERESWSAVFNCAAYTAVDKAEAEEDLAFALNATAPAILAQVCAARGIPLVQVSTDYVFSGDRQGAYGEDDPIAPLGAYGRSKAAGEQAVREAGGIHAIVRTAWVLSAGPRNFLDTMVRLAADRDELRVVDDQHGCPTSAEDIAAALLTVAERLDGRSGTWHFVNAGETTWCGLASHIFRYLRENGCMAPHLVPIPTSEYPTPAARPANSVLSTARIEADFAIRPRPWTEAVDDLLHKRLNP